ncbi:aminotransferase class V-fold PLP-dependent enzyme [Marixanthomonas ophiurae]|uniref:Aminotransferase class V-fold PLP-dependent enzyme n=1 Tax=Marixanthomonas ophiurae TaxID=387659 RepID=A0A3E1QC79_9FLAO|nr:aminotransferase class V-fold PLP-dependent enzyme [Marixanthomonas ophiurae]RFN59704.1 aminotransferase class V-fold PLP-dependent enzyme [Marixanthomonas ophiurae]
MKDFKKHFPALQGRVYLNTPASGLLSKPVYNWRKEQEEGFLFNGNDYGATLEALKNVRETISSFFHASESNVALVPNFSFGLNTLLEGLPQKQKVLLLKGDYPSINWPVQMRDFDVCFAETTGNIEQNIEAAVTKHRPTVFVFSVVQWLSGIKIDFDFLKELKVYHPDLLLIADGTQYLGTEKFNFEESPLDVIGTSTYKWLLSGYGNGFFLFKESVKEKIFPNTIGFNSAANFDSSPEEITFTKHFEPGHLGLFNYGSLRKSLQFMEELGVDIIQNKIKVLSEKAKLAFMDLGLLNDTIVNRENHSPIFNIKGDAVLFQKLKKNNIICSQRGGGIRVGFHFYNSEEDLEALLEILKH